MKWSRLRNKYLKSKKLQHGPRKKECFNDLDTKKVINKRNFWGTVIPIFSNNTKSDKIFLNRDSKTLSDKKNSCRTFTTYFANIVSDLQILNIQENIHHASDIASNRGLC